MLPPALNCKIVDVNKNERISSVVFVGMSALSGIVIYEHFLGLVRCHWNPSQRLPTVHSLLKIHASFHSHAVE